MKILFVNPPFKAEYGKFSREARSPMITNSGVIYYPLWLLYAAGVCEKEGNDIYFLDAPAKKMNHKDSFEWIENKKIDFDMIVVDTSTPSIYNDVKFAGDLKDKYPKSFVIMVGTHPSALPEETLKLDERVDAVACGEFDYVIRDLAKCLESKGKIEDVKGIAYINKVGEFIQNEKMEPITDLDNIPFAAELINKYLDPKDYFFAASSYPEVQIFTGRGCPARCYFCVYPQVMHGHIYRTRSAENVVAEFEYVVKNMPDVKEIVIEDDTFTINKERTQEICKLLVEKGINKKIKWLCNARVNLDYETMKLMKKAGCKLIIPGIENGTQEMLNNMKKGTTLKQIKEYVKNAQKAGLLVHACYMVGNKGETRETMEKTLKLAIELNADTAQFYTLHVYPGTEAYDWAKTNGYIITDDFSQWIHEDGSDNTVISLDNISDKELVDFCNYARRKYYLRPKYILMKVGQSITNFDEFKRNVKGFVNFAPKLLKKGKKKDNVK